MALNLAGDIFASADDLLPAGPDDYTGFGLVDAGEAATGIVDIGDDSRPVAAKFVEATEMSERNGDGKAETEKKTAKDLSHWMAAARYALWSIEKPRYQELGAATR